jgi:hypothetical protein
VIANVTTALLLVIIGVVGYWEHLAARHVVGLHPHCDLLGYSSLRLAASVVKPHVRVGRTLTFRQHLLEVASRWHNEFDYLTWLAPTKRQPGRCVSRERPDGRPTRRAIMMEPLPVPRSCGFGFRCAR